MLITPQNFPVLEWTSYRPGTEPENLNIAAVNQKGFQFMKNSKEFNSMFGLLGFDYYAGNSLAERIKKQPLPQLFQPHKHLYLSESTFKKVEYDNYFRAKMWQSLRYLPSTSGSILFTSIGGRGQYFYRILNVEDTHTFVSSGMTHQTNPPKESRWFAACLFLNDMLVGFECGVIDPNGGIQIDSRKGYYNPSSEVGQFISFVGISLVYWYHGGAETQLLPPNSKKNKSSQTIILL